MCIKCQNVYCQRCIDNWNKNEKKCPNNCEAPEYNNCIAKNEILSKLKFTCVGCNEEIDYNNAENHHELCCPGKTSANIINKKENQKSKFRRLTTQEAQEFNKNKNEILFITSMYIDLFLYFIIYSNNIGNYRSRKIYFNRNVS